MSIRSWVSIITLLFLALIVYLARHEIAHAWRLLDSVNLYILALLIPAQLVAYFTAGEMMFAYLRAKKATKHISALAQTRMALEMNFVNHVLPSAGVSGISYMSWRLNSYGISSGRATVAQMVRYVAGFASFATLLLAAVVVVTIDGNINRWIILLSSLVVLLMVVATGAVMYLLGKVQRFTWFSNWLAAVANQALQFVTFGRANVTINPVPIVAFFTDMHGDYIALRKERHILIKPYLWGLIFNAFDVLVFVIAFWALGHTVNPAPILIGYGLASMAGFLVFTPGGAGAYEAIMIFFLSLAGVPPDVAIAGVLLTRVALLLGTIGLGYLFYQHAVLKYGKTKPAL